MVTPETDHTKSAELVVPRSHRLVRRLAMVYGALALAMAGLLCADALPRGIALQAVAHEAIVGGLAGTVLPTLLLALAGLLGTLALTTARFRSGSPAAANARWSRLLQNPGSAARLGQAVVIPASAVVIYVVVRLLWPGSAPSVSSTSANIGGALTFALTFTSLVAQRTIAEFPEPQLPEAPALRRLLLLVTVLLGVAACIELGRGAMLDWVRWPQYAIAVVTVLIAVELSLRAFARLFLPSPAAAKARAVVDSVLVAALTGRPRSPGSLLRTHLGLDFARSWALSFLSAALLPALLITALFCWGLTGLKLVDLGHRGIYERFGAPVEVLGPGLHLILPWPFGRLRPVEFGTIHSVAIGVDSMAKDDAQQIGAEDVPQASLNRLWETAHSGQAYYLIASLGSGQQGFQSVATEISVLYRVGLSDEAALQSNYAVADPESLIRQAGSRMALRYFNSRTLESVLGASRETVAASMRDALTADVNSHRAGLEIVSVLIEEIHPPAGAAAAYHAVQAAQINASASISNERGRAKRVAGVAQQEAHQLTASADATATERLRAADADAYRFAAERRAHAEAGQAYLFERSLTGLRAALAQKPLILIDHRLSAAQAPIFDLRSAEQQNDTSSDPLNELLSPPPAPEGGIPPSAREPFGPEARPSK
ncbi:MAG: SPFH domain-containing protein [Gammaproteobacteria bacterium]